MSAAGAWQPVSDHVKARDVSVLRRVSAQTRRLAADGRNVPRYCFKYGVTVLAMFGLLQLWQAGGDGAIPTFKVLHPSSGVDPFRTSHPQCIFAEAGDSTRWQALAPALTILAEVNPEVARWVQETRQNGKLIFTNRAKIGESASSQLAKYDVLRRELTVGRGLFAENDGTVAAVLCHEYRHSRQRFPKTMVYALSFLLSTGGDPAIVENDALLYEQEANLAIFGKYQDR
jgi:hypothetical protein